MPENIYIILYIIYLYIIYITFKRITKHVGIWITLTEKCAILVQTSWIRVHPEVNFVRIESSHDVYAGQVVVVHGQD